MTVWEFLILLLVAAVCGGVAQAIAGFSRGGLLVSIAVGFIGAMIGMWLQREMGAPELLLVQVGDAAIPVVWSIIGGVVFVAVVALFTRPRRAYAL